MALFKTEMLIFEKKLRILWENFLKEGGLQGKLFEKERQAGAF